MKNTIAIMYDFDKTLSTKDMQDFNFIPSLGYTEASDFWKEVTAFRKENKMDGILGYMYYTLKKANELGISVNRELLGSGGKSIEYYPGVEDWFERINKIGRDHGLVIEHYIISSGLKEIIENTKIAKEFKKIYGCSYIFDENGNALWPAFVVNYTTKTQYLFRINKQVLDETNDDELNSFVGKNERAIPFNHMIYIGDGLTDVPCMQIVTNNNGNSIAVYNKTNEEMEQKSKELFETKRCNFYAEANYSKDSKLEKIVECIFKDIENDLKKDELKNIGD